MKTFKITPTPTTIGNITTKETVNIQMLNKLISSDLLKETFNNKYQAKIFKNELKQLMEYKKMIGPDGFTYIDMKKTNMFGRSHARLSLLQIRREIRQTITKDLYTDGARSAAEGNHAFLPALPLRGGQAVRVLDDCELPRSVRDAPDQRHFVQPRVASPRPHFRDPQNHPRGGPHLQGLTRLPVPRQHGLAARLGPRARLRGGHVAHGEMVYTKEKQKKSASCVFICFFRFQDMMMITAK